MKIHPMWQNYPNVATDLSDMLQLIEDNVHVRNKEIEQTILDLIHAGGKLLRPAYSLLFSSFGPKQQKEKNIAVAAAIEVLHMATLVHDDVIDDAPTRRGLETIQSKYGKDIAVYTGDYLFTVCFRLLAKYADSLDAIETDTKGMERILMGELDQMHLRYNQDVTIRQYLKRISGKTAQLFALSCYSGAFESGCSKELARKSYYIGNNIGMAFQIMDDILDYSQTADGFGKPVLEDIKQGVYTSPLIYAMQGHKEAFRPLLAKGQEMTATDVAEIQALIKQYQGVEKAHKLATKYTNKALKEMNKLPESSEKEQLILLTKNLLARVL